MVWGKLWRSWHEYWSPFWNQRRLVPSGRKMTHITRGTCGSRASEGWSKTHVFVLHPQGWSEVPIPRRSYWETNCHINRSKFRHLGLTLTFPLRLLVDDDYHMTADPGAGAGALEGFYPCWTDNSSWSLKRIWKWGKKIWGCHSDQPEMQVNY